MGIQISKIDDKMSIYKENKIILWKLNFCDAKYIMGILADFASEKIEYIADDEHVGETYKDIPVISEGKMWELLGEPGYMLQIGSSHWDEPLEKVIHEMNGQVCYVTWQEFFERTLWLGKYLMVQKMPEIKKEYIRSEIYCRQNPIDKIPFWDYIARSCMNDKSPVFLCLPPKTGDYTLEESLRESGIDACNLWHSAKILTENVWKILGRNERKVKIITAVRNPINQNLSAFFQRLSSLWELPEYWENGGDLEKCLEKFMECELNFKQNLFGKYRNPICRDMPAYMAIKEKEGITYLIQDFFENGFSPYIGIDVMKYPFDKESGYAIIKQEHKEVFIYQLERMDEIMPEMGKFLGREIHISKSNVGDSKWYGDAYKEAKKQLLDGKMSKYYDYDGCGIIKHFYKRGKDMK